MEGETASEIAQKIVEEGINIPVIIKRIDQIQKELPKEASDDVASDDVELCEDQEEASQTMNQYFSTQKKINLDYM